MKKIAAITLFSVVLMVASTAQASYVTTLDFFGGMMIDPYDGTGFPDDSTPNIGTQSWDTTSSSILSTINSEAPYLAVLAVSYDVDSNLPDWNQDYEWVLGYDVWVEGTAYYYNPDQPDVEDDFGAAFADSINLGTFALSDSGYTEAQVVNFLTGIPTEGYDEDIGGYLIDGNLQSGTIYAALEEDVRIPSEIIGLAEQQFGEIDWDAVTADFGGRITLTALSDEDPVVPEPATMALFGLGFLGFAGIRKRK